MASYQRQFPIRFLHLERNLDKYLSFGKLAYRLCNDSLPRAHENRMVSGCLDYSAPVPYFMNLAYLVPEDPPHFLESAVPEQFRFEPGFCPIKAERKNILHFPLFIRFPILVKRVDEFSYLHQPCPLVILHKNWRVTGDACADYNDLPPCLQPVHQGEELAHHPALHLACGFLPLRGNGIYLVHEYYRGRVLLRVLEYLAQLLLGLAHELAHK